MSKENLDNDVNFKDNNLKFSVIAFYAMPPGEFENHNRGSNFGGGFLFTLYKNRDITIDFSVCQVAVIRKRASYLKSAPFKMVYTVPKNSEHIP